MKPIKIIHAKATGNLSVELIFNDGSCQVINVGAFIKAHPHPQYNKYLDPRKFSRFTIENGNIVWGKNWDLIFPIEDLHAGSIVY